MSIKDPNHRFNAHLITFDNCFGTLGIFLLQDKSFRIANTWRKESKVVEEEKKYNYKYENKKEVLEFCRNNFQTMN